MSIEQLGPVAAAAAAKGERVVTWGNGYFCSFPSASRPERAFWGTTISKAQRPYVMDDLAAIGSLAIGESRACIKGSHPKHGTSYVTVTRVA